MEHVAPSHPPSFQPIIASHPPATKERQRMSQTRRGGSGRVENMERDDRGAFNSSFPESDRNKEHLVIVGCLSQKDNR
ncbi:hypothetical protein CEXT_807751 [Caerostris extrusa]|uniref:Uncharacterized protein n=1 Tax=Caerostris extrusa TaxID=172846 RepID=A0AAV4V608_CAEEX|nr:hypothetical protein CEXT_807751 [Caerostris extrusa]